MSQVSIIDIEGTHPQIPTEFIADSGSAIPLANILEIYGDVSPAGSSPVFTVGSGNNITTFVQIAQSLAASDVTKIGLANFDSSAFTVDANGFVTLNGGGGATTELMVDTSTVPGTNPVVPNGSGVITVTGGQVAGGTIGANVIRTNSLAANTMVVEIQRSTATVVPNSSFNGVAHFDQASFTVDSTGFVQLTGGGLAIDSVGVQAGTSPITPTAAGLITINGALVAAGTNPVRSNGTGANTLAIEVQTSQALAATDATKVGLSNFDSAAFSVDANGFVTLNGGGAASTSFDVQSSTAPGTDPVIATAGGLVTVNGAAVANHSVVLETHSRAANAFNVEVQYATSAASTDATKSGVAHFDSASFAVDANGFVQLSGGGLAIDSIHPDSGTDPVVPTAGGLVNIVGSGSTTTVGSLNTLTVQLTGLTNHAVLVGAGTTTITKVGPTATAGQVLQSAGSSSDPAFSTATYPSTTTVSQILYSSSTNVVSGLATANRATLVTNTTGVPVMTSSMTNGQVVIGSTSGTPTPATLTAGTNITITNAANSITINAATAFTSSVIQVFTSSGTYTPTSGMKYCIIELVGGGGGGGGCSTTGSGTVSAGAGGGGGGYARGLFTAADIGASKTVTIGAAGSAGTAGGGGGGTGGTTSVSTLLTGTGGVGGGGSSATGTTISSVAGGDGGSGGGTGADITARGSFGTDAFGFHNSGQYLYATSGSGGASFFGGVSRGVTVTGSNSTPGRGGNNYGGGGSGAACVNASQNSGGAGAAGCVVITEFI